MPVCDRLNSLDSPMSIDLYGCDITSDDAGLQPALTM